MLMVFLKGGLLDKTKISLKENRNHGPSQLVHNDLRGDIHGKKCVEVYSWDPQGERNPFLYYTSRTTHGEYIRQPHGNGLRSSPLKSFGSLVFRDFSVVGVGDHKNPWRCFHTFRENPRPSLLFVVCCWAPMLIHHCGVSWRRGCEFGLGWVRFRRTSDLRITIRSFAAVLLEQSWAP